MKHISLTELARVSGISKASLYRNPAIQEMIASTQAVADTRTTKLYPIAILPPDIRKKLPPNLLAAESSISTDVFTEPEIPIISIVPPNPQYLEFSPIPVPPRNAEQVDAWIEIFRIRADWCVDRDFLGVSECDKAFAAAVADKKIPSIEPYLPAIAWGKKLGLSKSSIARQREKFHREGLAGYARDTSKDLQSSIDKFPQIQNWILNFAMNSPEAPIAKLYREFSKWHCTSCSCPLPCQTTVRNWLRQWKIDNRSTWLKETAPDKWRSEFRVAFGTQNSTTAPNQIWELDSTIADRMIEGGRHYVLGLIDVHTRQAFLLVSKSSQASAVLSLLRMAILEWGVPESIRIDNGSDYVSEQVKRFCAQARIRHDVCTPGTPQAKPYIERFWGTFNHSDMPALAGYTGHNVATAQTIRSRNAGKPIAPAGDATAFQYWCDSWLLEYNDRPHQGLGGITPNQSRANSLKNWQPTLVADIRQLDMLLASVGKRKVLKQGIKLDGGWYLDSCLAVHVGEMVWVSRDAIDLGRIYLFDEDNNYIGEAIDAELLGIDRREIALKALALQNADIRAKKQEIRRAKSNKKRYENRAIEEAKVVVSPPPANVVCLDSERSRRDPNAVFGVLAKLWASQASPEVILSTCSEKELRIAAARAASGNQSRLIVTNSRLEDTKRAEREFVPWVASLANLFPTINVNS